MRGDNIYMCNANKIEEIIKQFDTNIDRYEMAKYKVTEISPRLGNHTYIVHNLEAEYENGGVYFGDIENVISDNQYSLMGFLIDSIINIIFEDKCITIAFRSNSIKIELVD